MGALRVLKPERKVVAALLGSPGPGCAKFGTAHIDALARRSRPVVLGSRDRGLPHIVSFSTPERFDLLHSPTEIRHVVS